MRWLWRGLAVVLLALVALALPVGYVETMCRPEGSAQQHTALIAPEHHRPEARTLMTYPEWHIVHAYDDYARTIAQGDPHDFGYLRAIGQFWSSLCTLSRQTGPMGGIDGGTRQMVHVIGVSFTAELALKAAYEETLGRIATWVRGPDHAPLDRLSAQQAADYVAFLQQVPWYKWDFTADRAALNAQATGAFRDRERALALGLEYSAKAAYAGVIEQAVQSVGADALRLRMVVTGLPPAQLAQMPEVEVIGPLEPGIEVETPRYRALTKVLVDMAEDGANFVEIAGNQTIMFTAISASPTVPGALMSLPRQGYGDTRHLIVTPVAELADRLRALGDSVEHIHDY
ncbi:hypothetical protein [Arenibacterium halophilum]|uniref:Uncharacterized protein n=1 Tax=Arenibacterium halophilum TaxID=2583821 RepID=A0ABY2XFG2_9RHOB|nr:hypothetical protein [Arenibacterium halophilum]TMV15120.1 hypothetical protein FGK64_03925 [Arenibacterium halophilum]